MRSSRTVPWLRVSGLAERGVTVRAVDREHIKPGQPFAMTMHRAKGTEQYAEDAWADALLRER
jgi:hypothetical protein